MPVMLPWQSDVLQQALTLRQQQHLPHAVLLESASEFQMEGFARYLSMLLLCDNPQELALCGACEACRMMSAGTYADFSLVTLGTDDKTKKLSKNIKIEQIRNLIHELTLTRKFDRLKIAVIYPAELMNRSSANALLKTLEEPASEVLLVLLTRNPGRIPVTLRSRCQFWSVNPPDENASMTWLQAQGINADSARQYLQYAAGEPLLALHLQQQDYAQKVETFKTHLATFLRSELSASELCKILISSEVAVARRLIEMTLNAYCHQACGVENNSTASTAVNRPRARDLLDLHRRAQRQLLVEENNLDFQLQLEDVLISLKQIITRRSI
jgi:DNA polymerase-3 subunit delta'